jgi:hypothetical protein
MLKEVPTNEVGNVVLEASDVQTSLIAGFAYHTGGFESVDCTLTESGEASDATAGKSISRITISSVKTTSAYSALAADRLPKQKFSERLVVNGS